MQRPVLLLILTISFLSGYSQNWQCVNANETRYFVNDEHYLRAIKIDSALGVEADSFLFPFRSPRGEPFGYSFGGSWIGNYIKKYPDGSFQFFNAWNKAITIYPHATIDEIWILYADTLDIYFEAKVTAIDTGTVLGILDSIKTLTITAKQGTKILDTNICNNKEIILSKEHGLIKAFEFYYFPYRLPNTVSYNIPRTFDVLFNAANDGDLKDFRLINFYNPPMTEIYDYNVGDIMQYTFNSTKAYYIYHDEIIHKKTQNNKVLYSIKRTMERFWENQSYPYEKDYKISYEKRWLEVDSTPWLNYIPENKLINSGFLSPILYYPDDTSYCRISHKYRLGDVKDPRFIGNKYEQGTYKIGVGNIIDDFENWGPPEIGGFNIAMAAYSIDNHNCRNYEWPIGIKKLNNLSSLSIYPNPASNSVNIVIDNQSKSYRLIITNMIGNIVQSAESNKNQLVVPVSKLPTGFYNIQIFLENEIINERVIVQH